MRTDFWVHGSCAIGYSLSSVVVPFVNRLDVKPNITSVDTSVFVIASSVSAEVLFAHCEVAGLLDGRCAMRFKMSDLS